MGAFKRSKIEKKTEKISQKNMREKYSRKVDEKIGIFSPPGAAKTLDAFVV